MAITRKPLPTGDVPPGNPPPGNPPPLPYPVSPSSPTGTFPHVPPPQSTPPRPHFLDRPPMPPSHNSSVSDLSDGWVDTRATEHPAVSRTDLGPPYEPSIPSMLQVGTPPTQPARAAASSPRLFDTSGLDSLEQPDVPAPLRVTPPPSRTNNPFQRSYSPDNRTRTERRDGSPGAGTWTDLSATPPRGSGSNTPQPGSSTYPGSFSAQGESKQYRAYSPASADRPLHQASASMPVIDRPGNMAGSERVELPTSPTHQSGHGHSKSTDVYASLAELDDNLPQVARPPIPLNQPPQEPCQPPPQPPREKESLPPYQPPPPRPLQPEMTGANLPMSVEAESNRVTAGPGASASPGLDTSDKALLPTANSAESETPMMRANRQRAETYSVKKIRWTDSVSPELRSTPIMVQNANGPCPLLALVNALTLSTPADVETALVETLRSREQVTLGLLLDAVFEELMSGRRGNAAQDLPDVGELYSFLLTLHTGMNVNPRFIPPTKEVDLMDGFDTPRSYSYDGQRPPGGFEETREMKLYGTFSIALMHGWLPPRTHPAYAALKRSAATYEDAQNLLFREEELEEKLARQGLSGDEQQLLEDIATVKFFLHSSATQLTGYGLDVVTDAMTPGSIAILFRNDHFSTLYKHPRSGQLLQLVTDMGYAGHEEVVWESLVDVSGEGCEFYSGDFRPVGFSTPRHVASPTSPVEGSSWTTVPPRGKQGIETSDAALSSAVAPAQQDDEYNLPSPRNAEQEDADLALAMQLQEEEEETQRQASAQRQREEDASQAFLSQQAQQDQVAGDRNSSRRQPNQPDQPHLFRNDNNTANAANNRRVGNLNSPPPLTANPPTNPTRRPANARPAVHREASSGEDAPPPTYEQAARSTPYHGPVPNPGSGGGSGTGSGNDASYAQMRASNAPNRDPYTRSRNTSAYSQHRATLPNQPPPNPGTARRRASGAAGILLEENAGRQGREREREKDCVVM